LFEEKQAAYLAEPLFKQQQDYIGELME